MIRRYGVMLGVAVGVLGTPTVVPGQAGPVRAVLFYSPTCPHCHTVIREALPLVFARFGGEPQFYRGEAGHLLTNGQLEVLLVDGSHPAGYALYEATTRTLSLSSERSGVPRLLCGDSVLVGSQEIPERFPSLVERGLAAGGIGWPAIEGLDGVFPAGHGAGVATAPALVDSSTGDSAAGRVAEADTVRSAVVPPARPPNAAIAGPPPVPAAAIPAREPPAAEPAPAPVVPLDVVQLTAPGGGALVRTLRSDPVGGILALVVLLAMIVSLGLAVRRPGSVPVRVAGVAVPLLVVVGGAIAGYLTYVEASGVTAVCGPVGDCNTVQQSPYARLLGVPVALLGLAGYLAVLVTWGVARRATGAARNRAVRGAFLLALIGTVASAILTFLEPFVIGAVCAWCLASAVVMTALMWLLAAPARSAVSPERPESAAGAAGAAGAA